MISVLYQCYTISPTAQHGRCGCQHICLSWFFMRRPALSLIQRKADECPSFKVPMFIQTTFVLNLMCVLAGPICGRSLAGTDVYPIPSVLDG